MRRSKFDDFIFYDERTDAIWIGRRDVAWSGVWCWFCMSGDKVIRPNSQDELPKSWIVLDRQPEMSLFGG